MKNHTRFTIVLLYVALLLAVILVVTKMITDSSTISIVTKWGLIAAMIVLGINLYSAFFTKWEDDKDPKAFIVKWLAEDWARYKDQPRRSYIVMALHRCHRNEDHVFERMTSQQLVWVLADHLKVDRLYVEQLYAPLPVLDNELEYIKHDLYHPNELLSFSRLGDNCEVSLEDDDTGRWWRIQFECDNSPYYLRSR